MSNVCEGDFSDISDGEIVTATQLFEPSFEPDALYQLVLFSDISDYDHVNFVPQAELAPCDLTSRDSLQIFNFTMEILSHT